MKNSITHTTVYVTFHEKELGRSITSVNLEMNKRPPVKDQQTVENIN